MYSILARHATALSIAGAGVGWLVLNGADAYGKIDRAWEWWQIDQTISGYWTNDSEGHLDPPIDVASAEGERTELAVFVKGGNVSGDVHTERLCNFLPWQYVQIEGHSLWWGFGGIRAYAWDYVGGERRRFAELRLNYDRSTRTLVIERVSPTALFPERVRLFKIPEAIPSVSEKVKPYCPGAQYPSQQPKKRERVSVEQLMKSGQPALASGSASTSSAPSKIASRPASTTR
jgi:hypothetical protein